MMLDRAQCRAARALLDWSQEVLAHRARLTKKTIADFERGATAPYARTLAKIVDALELAGIELLNGGAPGVRLTKLRRLVFEVGVTGETSAQPAGRTVRRRNNQFRC
jgi:transcriptional regulator with XRE-family HTH domain